MSEKDTESTEEITSFNCPACKEGVILIKKTIYDLPDKDKMLILRFECNICAFYKNDIIPLTTRMEAGIMTLKISNEDDLKSKIYRSPTGILEIPEFDLKVEPGPSADFYYTNVEGILSRFEQAVEIYYNDLNDEHPEKNEIKGALEDLKKAMKGELEFTLIIEDPGGGSYIIPVYESKYKFESIKNLKSNNN